MRLPRIISITLAILIPCIFYSYTYPCDVAVVSANASTTGRPFIWKSRDCSANWHQEVKYFKAAVNSSTGATLKGGAYVMVISFDDIAKFNTGDPVNPSGGLNEAGFAISCTSVYEEFYPTHEIVNINTDLIREALQKCATLADFETVLANWRRYHPGKVISGNFVAIDASGGAALYECYTGSVMGTMRNIQYYKFDANTGRVTTNFSNLVTTDSIARQYGFVNRSNANTFIPYNLGEERRARATELFTDLAQTGRLNYRNCMTVVAKDVYGQQLDSSGRTVIDPGDCNNETDTGCMSTYSTTYSISRNQTRLAMVVDGVASGNDPKLSTFWCLLGEPALGVFIPYFVNARAVSWLSWIDGIDMDGNRYDLNDTSMLNRICNRLEIFENKIYDDNEGNAATGMNSHYVDKTELRKAQQWTAPLDDFIFRKTEEFLADLAVHPSYITEANLKNFSDYCAEYMYKNFNEFSTDMYAWTYSKPWDSTWDGYTRGGFENDFSSPAAPLSSYSASDDSDLLSGLLKNLGF